jgi:hypothetical protein
MVDQLDEARARDSFECRERPRYKALIEVDIIFHDDRSGIATVDELRQRQNMTAVTAILACESLSTIVIDELPLIEISALVFGDQSSVDRGRRSVRTALPERAASASAPRSDQD